MCMQVNSNKKDWFLANALCLLLRSALESLS
jgi:hypothetical protein